MAQLHSRKRWRLVRSALLDRHPLCRRCEADGRTVAATDVDHVVPLAEGGAPYDEGNLQPLCFACHVRKTKEDAARYGWKGRVLGCDVDGVPLAWKAPAERW